MEAVLITVSLLVSAIAIGLVVFFIQDKKKSTQTISSDLERQRENMRLEMKTELQQMRTEATEEIQQRRDEIRRLERHIERQEEQLAKQMQSLEERENALKRQEEELVALQQEAEELKQRQLDRLEKLAQMSSDEARSQLLEKWEDKLSAQISKRMREYQDYLGETCERNAIKVLAQAIQRCAVDHVVESTVSVVTLPSDDMKGRIIGREGRNIRALEMVTGVELLIDDTPEVVVISSFDTVRREIARRALEKLISDGRIHPTRIEEVVAKVKEELEDYMREEGEAAAMEVGVQRLHPEVIRLLGRLRYRSSYGQNILQHSKEVAYAAGIMAAEIGANVETSRRAGLLHDLGKALTYEEVGTHTALGIDYARRYNESPAVLHAMAAHHNDVEPQTIEAILVQVADTLSAARPGARSEPVEKYITRMRALETIASSFNGVEKAFVIQAGREVRVIVEPYAVEEDAMPLLAQKIAEKIESEMEYPGQIKVSIIRETRAASFAK